MQKQEITYYIRLYKKPEHKIDKNCLKILNKDERKEVDSYLEKWDFYLDNSMGGNAIIVYVKDLDGEFIPIGLQNYFLAYEMDIYEHEDNLDKEEFIEQNELKKKNRENIKKIEKDNPIKFIDEDSKSFNEVDFIKENESFNEVKELNIPGVKYNGGIIANGIFIEEEWRRRGIGLLLRNRMIEYMKNYYKTFTIEELEDTDEAYLFHSIWLSTLNQDAIIYLGGGDGDFFLGFVLDLEKLY